jgi:hypothetical protein
MSVEDFSYFLAKLLLNFLAKFEKIMKMVKISKNFIAFAGVIW